MKAIVKEFTKNKNNVRIVKCCASCQRCNFDGVREQVRICLAGHGEHANDYLCEDWIMKEHLQEFQMYGDGRIKKPSYFAWLNEQVSRLKKEDMDEKTRRAIILHLPESYEQSVGSRYLEI